MLLWEDWEEWITEARGAQKVEKLEELEELEDDEKLEGEDYSQREFFLGGRNKCFWLRSKKRNKMKKIKHTTEVSTTIFFFTIFIIPP